MSNFFSLSTGESAISESGSFESGGNMDPIPKNTDVLAAPDEAKWACTQDGDEYISIRWSVLRPAEYENRKIFQKIWVTDDKPNAKDPIAARDKAKSMLMAIDKNAGGNIAKAGVMPTDESLTKFLTNKMMILKLMVWEFDDKSGNWVSAVSPKTTKTTEAPAPAQKPPQTQAANMPVGRISLEEEVPGFDEDVGF